MPYLTLSQGFLILIVVVIPPMIYADAADHHIGRHPSHPGSLSAAVWASLAAIPFLGPTIAFYYFLVRPDLLRQARLHPVIVPENRRDCTCFLIYALATIAYGLLVGHTNADRTARHHSLQDTPSHLDPNVTIGDQ
jgi:hypothetical protein